MNVPVFEELARIREDHLETQIHHRLGNRIRNLLVVVHPEGVIIRGRTATYHAKQLAQHAVMDMTDRPILANDIEVY